MKITRSMLGPHCQAQFDAAMSSRKKNGSPQPQMNSWESRYADHLTMLLKFNKIRHFALEAVKIRLAKRTWYTPDFHVIQNDSSHEFHEVKGFWRDDARVKVKVAAENNRWAKFVIVTVKETWFEFEEIVP